MATLYERLGGKAAVDAAVDIFYDKVLKDQRINHYFKNVDMAQQRGKQKMFLTVVFGGANHYTGKKMKEAHAHLNLSHADFDAVIENLTSTLVELKVPADMIQECAEIAESTRTEIVTKD